MNALTSVQDQVLGLPGFDIINDKWNEVAEERFQTKDPYLEEVDGKTRKRKLDPRASNKEKKVWKQVQRMAWRDDKCFLGCYPVDCGIGLAPFLAFFIPTLGPLIMYAVHARMVHKVDKELHLSPALLAKMQSNIGLDVLISILPLIGAVMAWMHACSTRNASLVYNEMNKQISSAAAGVYISQDSYNRTSTNAPPARSQFMSETYRGTV